jgi:NAD-dependent dihydropyrimidine dehydrogenase PreA subunit
MIIQPETGIPAKCILCGECALACPREAIAFSCENIAKECP